MSGRAGIAVGQVAIFDLDGTLVNSEQEIFDSVSFALEQYQALPHDRDSLRAMIGHDPSLFFQGKVPEKEITEAVRVFRNHLSQEIGTKSFLYEGAREVLNTLRAMGLRLGVASNKSTSLAEGVLIHLGVDEFFDVVAGTEGRLPKPSPDVVRYVMDALGVDSGIMVGDTALDIQAGHAAGLKTVALGHGYGTATQLEMADFYFKDFRAFQGFLVRG